MSVLGTPTERDTPLHLLKRQRVALLRASSPRPDSRAVSPLSDLGSQFDPERATLVSWLPSREGRRKPMKVDRPSEKGSRELEERENCSLGRAS